MRTSILASAAILGIAGGVTSQSWDDLVANQWPGNSITKVSEKEFDAFCARHVARLGKAGAYEAFLGAQYRAYGLTTNSVWPASFLVPSADRTIARSQSTTDALVREGPEPNGSPNNGGTPTPIALGDQADGTINVGADQDWYVFTTPSIATVQAFTGPGLTGAGLPGALADTVVEIYDSAFNLVAVNDDHSNPWRGGVVRGTYSLCEVELPMGTYYCSVHAYGTSQTGSYSLDLRWRLPFQVVAEGPEPNDDPTNGGTPTQLPVGAQGDGTAGPGGGDRDWWSFTVSQQTSLLIETGPSLQNGNVLVDTTIDLRDSSGASLASDDDGGYGRYSQIEYTVPAGTYYLDVGGYGTLTGDYRVFLYQVAIPQSPVAEAAEPNGDPRFGGTPSTILCNQVGAGEILNSGGSPPGGDDDWWTLTTTQAGFSTIRTLPDSATLTGFGPIKDTRIWVYDAQFNLVAENDDARGRFSELTTWLEAGTYHVDVQGYGAGDIGTYYLSVSCPQTEAAFHAFAGGCTGSNGRAPRVATRDLELPILGATFVVDFVDMPASAAFFPLLGFSNTMTSGGVGLPFDLGLIGATGCSLGIDPLATLGAVATSTGTGTLGLAVPATSALIGVVVFTQAIVADPGVNPLGITTSNVAAIAVGAGY